MKLFYRRGFHATGIDTILAEAGVAKMTLYNHFKSKEELILVALQRHNELFRRWLTERVALSATEPRQRLIALFSVLEEWVAGGDFNGCMFINASAEYADPADPIHAAAAEHKRLVLNYIRELAVDAGVPDPDRLAMELTLLMEGATVWAQTTGDTTVAAAAGVAAATLVDRAFSSDNPATGLNPTHASN